MQKPVTRVLGQVWTGMKTLTAWCVGEKDLFYWRIMPKLVITGDGSSRSVNVNDPAEAVRNVASKLRLVASDTSVLASMQTWADDGFKRPIRLTVHGKTVVIEYRN